MTMKKKSSGGEKKGKEKSVGSRNFSMVDAPPARQIVSNFIEKVSKRRTGKRVFGESKRGD